MGFHLSTHFVMLLNHGRKRTIIWDTTWKQFGLSRATLQISSLISYVFSQGNMNPSNNFVHIASFYLVLTVLFLNLAVCDSFDYDNDTTKRPICKLRLSRSWNSKVGWWSNWLLCYSQLDLRLSWGCDNSRKENRKDMRDSTAMFIQERWKCVNWKINQKSWCCSEIFSIVFKLDLKHIITNNIDMITITNNRIMRKSWMDNPMYLYIENN
jgi:hypothetical protein